MGNELPALIKLLSPVHSITVPHQRCFNCERTYQVIHSYFRGAGTPLWPVKCPHCGSPNDKVQGLLKEGIEYLRKINARRETVRMVLLLEFLKNSTDPDKSVKVIQVFKEWVGETFKGAP